MVQPFEAEVERRVRLRLLAAVDGRSVADAVREAAVDDPVVRVAATVVVARAGELLLRDVPEPRGRERAGLWTPGADERHLRGGAAGCCRPTAERNDGCRAERKEQQQSH